MHIQRLESPSVDSLGQLERWLAAGTAVTVQFAAPPYPPAVLDELNRLAAIYGALLEVRFYAHYGSSFDCSHLSHLRDVSALSLDCLARIESVQNIVALERLTSLSLGVFELADGAVLRSPNLSRLSTLILGETRKNVFDLADLTQHVSLEHVRVCGHTKNLGAVATLPLLRELWLNGIPKRASVSFVSGIRELRSLHVYLGGRESLADLSAPHLQTLEVVRVRGLRDIGSLARFPRLRHFSLEDQPQMERIEFGRENAELEVVHVHNCRSLRALEGIDQASRLRELRVFRTAVEPEALRRSRFPESFEQLRFGTGKAAMDRRVRAESSSLGYETRADSSSIIGIDWQRA